MKATVKRNADRTRVRSRSRDGHFADKYTYRVQWSAEDGAHIANCLEFPTLAAHGSTPAEALKELGVVVRETLAWMVEEGEHIPEPLGLRKFKGNLSLRIPAELHRRLAVSSAEEGVSLNQYILAKIS